LVFEEANEICYDDGGGGGGRACVFIITHGGKFCEMFVLNIKKKKN